MITGTVLFLALAAGILPSLLWLYFWLREDSLHPEPRGLIIAAFALGMFMVPLAIPIEQFAFCAANGMALSVCQSAPLSLHVAGGFIILLWAAIEEFFKLGAAALIMRQSKAHDEPIDAMVYMITVALGFAALESALFFLTPFESGSTYGAIEAVNLRFVGPMLLHTLASAIVGASLAFSYYKTRTVKIISLAVGLILAITLHGFFNFIIITTNGEEMLGVFFAVWIGALFLLLLFEKAKQLYNRDLIRT